MTAQLQWTAADAGIEFRCVDSGTNLPVDQWALVSPRTIQDIPTRLGGLLRLLDHYGIEASDPRAVVVPASLACRLTRQEAHGLGLPPPSPFFFEVRPIGLLTDPDFRFAYEYVWPDGRPAMGVARTGCILTVGDQQSLLGYPLYPLAHGIDAFNQAPPGSLDGNFKAWAELQQFLPEDARVEDTLRSFRLVRASRLTIQPFVNEEGEPDFDPILGSDRVWENPDSGEEERQEFADLLPPERQGDFARQFRRRKVQGRYAAGGNWYVVPDESLRRALEIVKEKQSANLDERRAFITNPQVFIKAAYGDELSDDELEELFYDDGQYSERVKGIGFWEPKVLPWLKRTSESWIPEELGLRIGGHEVRIELDDVPGLLTQLEAAKQAGSPSIDYSGSSIPASEDAIDALRRLVTESKPKPDQRAPEEEREVQPRAQVVLLSKDNYEQLSARKERRGKRGRGGRVPALLRSTLFAHQKDALFWLQAHWSSGSRGALLADDMGLGKTLETMSFLAWLREEMQSGECSPLPILVVAPTGLLKNWQDEHEIHLDRPGIGSVLAAYGSGIRNLRLAQAGKQKELAAGLPVLDTRRLQAADWVLTTFETLRDYQHSFGRVEWAVIVFDEAQKIKNPTSGLTNAAQAQKAEFCLALTGTPVENHLADLWSICDAMEPGPLGDLKTFIKRYATDNPAENPEPFQELRQKLIEDGDPPFMRRRLKEDHIEGLPEKSVHVIQEVMPAVQAVEYAKIVQAARAGVERKGEMLRALQGMRSVSLHPYKRDEQADGSYLADSARLTATFNVLDEISSKGEKALIFVESRHMHGPLQEIIQRRYKLSQPPLLITGAVSGPLRKKRVDEFQAQSGFDVMLLSPKAGGVGLTLTAANHVIHLSRWWNPAVEDQCTDRVFRIGQKRPVHVYYPMAIHPEFGENSFDSKLEALLSRKRLLSRTILAPPSATDTETSDLFAATIGQPAGVTESRAQYVTMNLDSIDVMEPTRFEEWVLEELGKAKYDVSRTPKSWDKGADGVAKATDGRPSLIVQCKHTQRNVVCDELAVQEVLHALVHYDVPPPRRAVVVTNARGFSQAAEKLARAEDVELIDRNSLSRLRNL